MARRWTAYPYYLRSIWTISFGFDRPLSALRIILGGSGRERREIGLRRQAARFQVRGAMDVWSLKETFLDRLYERYGFTIRPGWTVVDIGGGIGDFSVFVARSAQHTLVHVFEPYPESFALLQENLARHNSSSISAHQVAIGRSTGRTVLDHGTGEPLRVRSGTGDHSTTSGLIEVSLLSLGDALDMIGEPTIDLLKLDCEGAEYEILMGADSTVLSRVDRIVLEYHDGFTSTTHEELAGYLRKMGYAVESFASPVHSYLGYMRAIRPLN